MERGELWRAVIVRRGRGNFSLFSFLGRVLFEVTKNWRLTLFPITPPPPHPPHSNHPRPHPPHSNHPPPPPTPLQSSSPPPTPLQSSSPPTHPTPIILPNQLDRGEYIIKQTRSEICYHLIRMNMQYRFFWVCYFGQYIFITALFDSFFVSQDLIDIINLNFRVTFRQIFFQ